VASHPTAAEVKAAMADKLGVPGERLLVIRDQTTLGEDACMESFSELRVVEVAPVVVRVLTGCCGESVPKAEVLVDGAPAGVTDEQGHVQVMVPLGPHVLAVRHSSFGHQPREPMAIQVCSGAETTVITVPVHARLFIYATDPDLEEDEALAGEDDEPLYDPCCVWAAADPDQIPEEALPLRGRTTCWSASAGRTLRVDLDPRRIVPFMLPLGQASSKPATCPLGALRLQCGRPGFRWTPKDPPPLEERAEELGGCEFPRLLECPVALGFLKPAVLVHVASGDQHQLPLDCFGEVQTLRNHLAELLHEADGVGGALQLVEAASGSPITGCYLKGSTTLICARPGESLEDARKKLQQQQLQQQPSIQGEEGVEAVAEEDGTVEALPLDETGAVFNSP